MREPRQNCNTIPASKLQGNSDTEIAEMPETAAAPVQEAAKQAPNNAAQAAAASAQQKPSVVSGLKVLLLEVAATTHMEKDSDGALGQVPAEPTPVLPQMSARQNKAMGAWNAHKKEVDKHFVSVFEGVERDITQVLQMAPNALKRKGYEGRLLMEWRWMQVDKGIQGSAFAARETHKNVGIAKV